MIEKLLQSSILKGFAFVVSVLAAIFKLAGGAFPTQIQNISIAFLVLAVAYLIVAALYTWRAETAKRRENEEEWRTEIGRKLESEERWRVEIAQKLESEGKWRTEIAQRLDAKAPEDQMVFDYTLRRYGLGYDLVDVECEISDSGVEVRRHLVARAQSVVEQIDNTLTLKTDPNAQYELLAPSIKTMDPSRTFAIESELNIPDAVVVNISPPLQPSESLDFTLTEEVKGVFYETNISRKKLESRRKENDQDFFAWRIDRPTKKLSLRVTFPKDSSPSLYTQRVFFAPVVPGLPLRDQHLERSRIQAPSLRMSSGQPQLTLVVNYPAVGLLYAIYWYPRVDESHSQELSQTQSFGSS